MARLKTLQVGVKGEIERAIVSEFQRHAQEIAKPNFVFKLSKQDGVFVAKIAKKPSGTSARKRLK